MGLMENRGFEVSAEYVKRFSKDLTVSVRGNFTFARNKVIDDGKYYAYPWQDQRGVRYGLTMGYRAMHLFSQEELDNMPDLLYAVRPGQAAAACRRHPLRRPQRRR